MSDVVLRFTAACESETAQLIQLGEVLNEEQRVLIGGSALYLEPVARAKVALLEELASLSVLRERCLFELGIQTTEALHDWLVDKPAATEAWQSLQGALNKVQAINNLNGQFINEKLTRTDEALNVLREAAISTLGYERDGSAPSLGGGRRFGSV